MTDKIKQWEERLSPSLSGIIDNIVTELKDGDVFYDIGANTGLLTQKVLEQKPNISCYLFEPVKEYYDVIIEKFQDDIRVKSFNVALLDDNRGVSISVDSSNLGWNTISNISHYGNVQDVEGRTLSDIMLDNDLEIPDVLKIDVEQSEWLVIKGYKRIMESGIRLPRKIFMEIGITSNNSTLWKEEVEMFEYLFSIGYKRFDYNRNDTYDAIFEL